MPPRKAAAKTSSASKASRTTQKGPSSPSPASKKKGGKRAKASSGDSDIEIVAVSVRSQKKQRLRQSTPPPGSDAFKNLPPVSTSSDLEDEILKNVPSFKFGTVDDVPAQSSKPAEAATPKRPPSSRKIVKSEKARHAEGDADSPQNKKIDASAVALESDDAGLQSKTDKGKGKQVRKKDSSATNDHHSDADSESSVPLLKHVDFFAPGSGDESGDDAKAKGSDHSNASGDDNKSDVSDADSELDDSGPSVMIRDIQDKALHKIYEDLPVLHRYCDVHPFNQYGDYGSARATFSLLCTLLSDDSKRLLLRGLRFVQSGDYVNMSRVSPTRLFQDSGVIKIGGTRRCAVGIMMGIVTECNIVNPGTAGPSNASYAVRRITLAPFEQEFRRDTSLWGAILEFRSITAVVGAGGISFLSRRQVEIPQGGDTTPKKNAAYLTQITSPLASSSAGRSGASYPHSRGFEDPIPIYDGRKHAKSMFDFSDQAFRSLSDLPLYRGGKRDLTDRAVVAVGYTVGTWTGRSGDKNLSTNLQFVVVVGSATAKPIETA